MIIEWNFIFLNNIPSIMPIKLFLMHFSTTLLSAVLLVTITLGLPNGTLGQSGPVSSDDVAHTSTADEIAEQVLIQRTDYGVPHIKAENLEAAGFAMGYIQVEDYGDEVIEDLLQARGEWSLYNEPEIDEFEDQIDSDAYNKRQYKRAVETYQQLDIETRQVIEGFAKGVNEYIRQNGDEFDGWVAPIFTAYDVHARGIGTPSQYAINRFLDKLPDQIKEDTTDEEATTSELSDSLNAANNIWARLSRDAEKPHPDVGSNAWALSSERSESGNAMLVRNPHLSWDAGYYEAQMTVPGKLNFYGDFRMGGPFGIIGGFNEHLGWATTNNNPDTDEIYAFETDPERPDHFIVDGASLPIEKETVTVEFKNGNSTGYETRDFYETQFGPVIARTNGKIYVIKSADDGEFRMGEQFFNMMKASNHEEWKEAMQMRARTSSNLIYADDQGNAYYVWNATTPKLPHMSGEDTTAVNAYNTTDVWQEPIEWEKLPQLLNPEGGYVRNENDSFHFTNLNEPFDPENFPPHYPEPNLRLRSQHSLNLIANEKTFSLEEVVEEKNSMRMLLADRVKEDLIAAVKETDPAGKTKEALSLIANWDNTVARDSRGGVLFKTWWWRYEEKADTSDNRESTPESAGFAADADSLFTQPWSQDQPDTTPHGLAKPELAAEAFEWAIDEAEEEYGGWDKAWGDVHRARIGDKDVAVGGCTGLLGCFRVLWFTEHEDDEQKREVRGGDGWVIAVEFADTPKAYSVLAYGQSNKEDSPYYNNQLELFANNEMKRVLFTEEDIKENIEREYHPGQEDD